MRRRSLRHKGCELSYRLHGEGEPILFIQGVGVHGDGWKAQTDVLSDNYRCLSFDNRGSMSSQPLGNKRLSVDLMAEDAIALAKTLGWEDCHIVGHSMGGHIALAIAILKPELARSLTLMCTSAKGKDIPPVTFSMLWTGLRSRVGTKRQRRRAFLKMVLPKSIRETGDPDEWAEELEAVFGHDLAVTPSVVSKQVSAYRAFDAAKNLANLAGIPTLVVSASEDPISTPEIGRSLSAGIYGSRFVEFEDASHGLTATHPRETNRLLSDHFAEVDLNLERND